MHMKDNLINFLYDKKYFINIYDEFIHVFNYQELVSLSSKKIVLKMETFKIEVTGDNLFITRMLPNEILIKGIIGKLDSKEEVLAEL